MGPFDILAEQHRELEDRLETLASEEERDQPESKDEQLTALATVLREHTRLEERYLWPLLVSAQGRLQAREEAEDHLAMQELVEELEELAPGEDEWWARLTALEDLLVAHVREEEVETFPQLSALLDEDQQEELSRGLWSQHEQWLQRTGALSASAPLLDEPRSEV